MPDIMFTGGEGSWLIAEDGRRYLDFTSGIGVNALGHGAPEDVLVARALEVLKSWSYFDRLSERRAAGDDHGASPGPEGGSAPW